MKRRDFLLRSAQVSSGLVAGLTSGLVLNSAFGSRSAFAEGHDDTLYVTIQASGGWDPCILMDPQTGEDYASFFTAGQILQAGSLSYAPKSTDGEVRPYRVGPGNLDFFAKYQPDLFVMRGVDTQTNSHLVGQRHIWTGNIRSGTPTLTAFMAANRQKTLQTTYPMAFMSTGGFDATSGTVPLSRVGSADAVLRLATPYVVAPSSSETRFFPESVRNRIRLLESERHNQLSDQMLPAPLRNLNLFKSGKESESSFTSIRAAYQSLPDIDAAYGGGSVLSKAKVAIAALQSGVAVSANLHIGGFDTHSTHDEKHIIAAQNLFDLVDYTVTTLKTAGLWDRTVLLIGSDFSRTIYNKPVGDPLRGKDHWPVTSLMAMGRGIPGGKVIGSTTPGPLKGVVATSLKVDNGALVETESDDPASFLLRPGHLHSALHASVGVTHGEIEDQLLEPEMLWA